MNTLSRSLWLCTTVAGAVLIAGCSNDPGSAPTTPAPTSSGAPQMSDLQSPPQRLLIDATIKHGEVIPTGRQLKATVNETIVVRISSDSEDELQVNSTPEHRFAVAAKTNQSFQFSIGSPGKVNITLKTLNKTIATVDVQ
jgi:PBP1b-binding outer membrane lipoprotein LpoB